MFQAYNLNSVIEDGESLPCLAKYGAHQMKLSLLAQCDPFDSRSAAILYASKHSYTGGCE